MLMVNENDSCFVLLFESLTSVSVFQLLLGWSFLGLFPVKGEPSGPQSPSGSSGK